MLQDLNEKDLNALYDLLATYTSEYTQIVRWRKGEPESLKECENIILQLQSEIDSRKKDTLSEQPDKDLDEGLNLALVLA